MKKLYVLVIIGVFFASTSSIFVKFSEAPSFVIAFYRVFIASLIWLIPLIIKEREVIKYISKRDFIFCCFSGIFLALFYVFWITSLEFTTVANASVLGVLCPVFVALFSRFFLKEKFNKAAITGITLAIIGGIIITLQNSNLDIHGLKGNLFALLGTVFISGYYLIGGKVCLKMGFKSYVVLVYMTSSIVLLSLCLIFDISVFAYSRKEFLIFIGHATFCSVIGHGLYNCLLESLSSTFIAAATLGEPIFASVMAVVLFYEVPTVTTILGSLCVIGGLFLYIINAKENIYNHEET